MNEMMIPIDKTVYTELHDVIDMIKNPKLKASVKEYLKFIFGYCEGLDRNIDAYNELGEKLHSFEDTVFVGVDIHGKIVGLIAALEGSVKNFRQLTHQYVKELEFFVNALNTLDEKTNILNRVDSSNVILGTRRKYISFICDSDDINLLRNITIPNVSISIMGDSIVTVHLL